MNKKGDLGAGIMMIYRIIIIGFIAFAILGISTIKYSHYVDVRDARPF